MENFDRGTGLKLKKSIFVFRCKSPRNREMYILLTRMVPAEPVKETSSLKPSLLPMVPVESGFVAKTMTMETK